jgi:prevent-host-death family protein
MGMLETTRCKVFVVAQTIGVIMRELAITQDISPLSEFIAGVDSFLKKVCNTGPLVITKHGKGVAVLLEVGEYETMQAKIELLEDIQHAEKQLEKGFGIEHQTAKAKIIGSPVHVVI